MMNFVIFCRPVGSFVPNNTNASKSSFTSRMLPGAAKLGGTRTSHSQVSTTDKSA
jgi:hypothetical protein